MLNANVIVRLTVPNEIHSEGGIVHDVDNVVGQHVEQRDDLFPPGHSGYVVTTGVEGYGSMASYEIPAEYVEEIEELG